MTSISEENLELSMQERMQLAIRRSSRFFGISEGVIYGAMLFLLLGLVGIYGFNEVISNSGNVEQIADCNQGDCYQFSLNEGINPEIVISQLYNAFVNLEFTIFVAMAILGGMIIWIVIRGRYAKNDLKKIRNDYTEQAYFFVLSTSLHGKDIALDFFDAAVDVFPELKKEELLSMKESKEQLEVEDLILEKATENEEDYRFDVVAKTKEGFFAVKYFDKDHVSLSEVKEMLKIAKEELKTWTKGIFRLVCLAKGFEKEVLEKYEEIVDKEIPLDLIIVKQKGYEFAKIGTEED